MKKIQIIGAGIGALNLGIRLQYAGFDVHIFEKNHFAGGVVHTVFHQNYPFDGSASIMISPDSYSDIFKNCDRNPSNYYTQVPLQETFRVFPKSQAPFAFPTEPTALLSMIANHFPRSLKGYLHFLNQTSARYSNAQKYLLKRRFASPITLCSPTLLYHTYRLHTCSSASHYLTSLIPDQVLRDTLLFQTLFMGYTPYKSPNIYTAIPAVIQLDSLSHIKGGLSAYTDALVKLFTELGGKLYLGTPVKEILFSHNHAVGIRVGAQTDRADCVVVATDYRYAYTKLIPKTIRYHLMHPLRFKTLKSSTGVYILRLVCDQPLPHLGLHNLALPHDFRQAMIQTFDEELIPHEAPLYIYYPAAVDETFTAPSGHVSFHVLVRVPHLKNHYSHSPTVFDPLKLQIIHRLEEITGLTSLSEHILFEKAITPYDFFKDYHYTDGCAFGLAHTFTQSMALRPQVSVPSIHGLYFVGCNIHPGNGISIVMESARLAADQIISSHTKRANPR
ncbi:MAG: phytoene desaturase family protein [Cellulosilyticaceae bacterium]